VPRAAFDRPAFSAETAALSCDAALVQPPPETSREDAGSFKVGLAGVDEGLEGLMLVRRPGLPRRRL
jgi:hypothetical protein